MTIFVRDGWEEKTLSMADLDDALCRVSTLFHIDDPKFGTVQDVLRLVVGQCEYKATDP